MRRIRIFDTTLRDGEQSPGIALRPEQKAEIALALEDLGVDIIEAGFAASSPGDFAGVRAVSEAVSSVTVASLCRTTQGDIDASVEALQGAPRSRLHVFIATSALHMERKLALTPDQVLEQVGWAVDYARSRADEVEFSAEDATRSDRMFLAEIGRVAIDAGADVINLPDTVGYALPDELARMLGGDTITDGLRRSAREMLGARHADRGGESERAKGESPRNSSKSRASQRTQR